MTNPLGASWPPSGLEPLLPEVHLPGAPFHFVPSACLNTMVEVYKPDRVPQPESKSTYDILPSYFISHFSVDPIDHILGILDLCLVEHFLLLNIIHLIADELSAVLAGDDPQDDRCFYIQDDTCISKAFRVYYY